MQRTALVSCQRWDARASEQSASICAGLGAAALLPMTAWRSVPWPTRSAAWTAFSLHWAYSEGDRAGVLQKFSKKGWLCKTYEGELALCVSDVLGRSFYYRIVQA